ncbi:predicted protein [Nematostella vectensis]|uniref:DUF885 domain-containing protein n=1 Tax=Nematostella vectensis TaxID=45351 RepID=A7SIJ5_NEMVE|nr:predicted protein [Nematostella vectensis]|eukprot:XP_001628525.1 predicted protein [Nematostella vectensis]
MDLLQKEITLHRSSTEESKDSQRKESLRRRRILAATFLVVLAVCCLACTIIVATRQTLVETRRSFRPRRSIENTNLTTNATTSPAVDPCEYSDEAKRAGLPEFLLKIRKSYLTAYPFVTLYISGMTYNERRQAYRPFNPTPDKLKSITDSSLALAQELRQIQVNKRRLKRRERKIFAQAEYFLDFHYGSPFLDNYYSGSDCGREGISYAKVQLATLLVYFTPQSPADLEAVIRSIQADGRGITQYEKNVRRGVVAGMVRSAAECRAGYDCLSATYPEVAERFSAEDILGWIEPGNYIMNTTAFFRAFQPNSSNALSWIAKHGETHMESFKKSIVEHIGKPLVLLLRYLRDAHSLYCAPNDVITGMSSLPLDYVYFEGRRTGRKTRKILPGGEIVRGADAYDNVLAYFTTLPYTAGEELLIKIVQSVLRDRLQIARPVRGPNTLRYRGQSALRYRGQSALRYRGQSTLRYRDAQRFCPKRYETMLKWIKVAKDSIDYINPKLKPLFHHEGPMKTTPSCPVSLAISFNPAQGVQSYAPSQSWCPRPAYYYIPFFVDRMGPPYAEWAVSAHEARPGHHLQIQGFIENFRDLCALSLDQLEGQQYTAFSEGWGMFAENPITTMDTDVFTGHPLEYYGMVKAQLWRALRLIIDPGLHYKGMSRDEAKSLFSKYLWDDSDVVDKEITRYQSWPGQAATYMTGQLAFWEIRKEAKARLGDKFNMKDFHYHLLSQGEVPMTYVKEYMQHYMDCVLDPSGEGCGDILDAPTWPKTNTAALRRENAEMELKKIWEMKKALTNKNVHHNKKW